MQHVMSPNGVAALLLLALVVDYLSIGPNSIRDRIAFLLALPAIREGFGGSPLAHWTVGAVSNLIEALKHASHGAYIAGAGTQIVLSIAIDVLAIYTVGALLPERLSQRLGKFAAIAFPQSGLHRINYRLWTCAALLGMLCDLSGGSVGNVLRGAIDLLASCAAPITNFLFGVI